MAGVGSSVFMHSVTINVNPTSMFDFFHETIRSAIYSGMRNNLNSCLEAHYLTRDVVMSMLFVTETAEISMASSARTKRKDDGS